MKTFEEFQYRSINEDASSVLTAVEDVLNRLKGTAATSSSIVKALNSVADNACAYLIPRDDRENDAFIQVTIYNDTAWHIEEYDIVVSGECINRKWTISDWTTKAIR
jgi:hypothetical protein